MDLLWFSALAALISIDITAYGQFMVSRPMFCAPVVGWLLGDLQTGLWVGMIVELIWISAIPMGAAVPADTTSTSLLALFWALTTFPGQRAAVVLALALAVPAGILFRKVDVWARAYNVRLAHWIEEGVRAGAEGRLRAGIYLGVLLFFVKAFAFYLVLGPFGQMLMDLLFPLLPNSVVAGFTAAWRLLPVAGFGLFLVNFGHGTFFRNRHL